ncbi:hypothetical protein R3P38DRAFT_3267258 [Favolaschia claudopus]|uniref:Uncharacterized protein n=1 Tax=Favolaschia claudopus TaxID=2862362 RepID=A0AAW0BNX5_9AGAR
MTSTSHTTSIPGETTPLTSKELKHLSSIAQDSAASPETLRDAIKLATRLHQSLMYHLKQHVSDLEEAAKDADAKARQASEENLATIQRATMLKKQFYDGMFSRPPTKYQQVRMQQDRIYRNLAVVEATKQKRASKPRSVTATGIKPRWRKSSGGGGRRLACEHFLSVM